MGRYAGASGVKMSSSPYTERFRSGVEKYAAFLETVEGRLRLDLTWANLQEFLLPVSDSSRVLDLGGGTGAMAIRFAQRGYRVTLLDSSQPMLEFAESAALQAGMKARVELRYGDASALSGLFPKGSFDVILCHNVLEYVDDPSAVLRSAAQVLREGSSVLSILVRSQAGDVLKAAIREGDLAAAERNLTAGWGYESLYGSEVRLFGIDSLRGMLASASLKVEAERGVRVASDYLPAKISRENEYQRILELERKLGARPEFTAIARYTHCLAHRGDTVRKSA